MMIYTLGKLLKNSSTEKVAGTAWWAWPTGGCTGSAQTTEGRNGLRSVSGSATGERIPGYDDGLRTAVKLSKSSGTEPSLSGTL
jgi:hypothetical protein